MPEYRDADELDVIQAAIDGDERAFAAVVDHYAARLRWLIRLRLDPALRARVSADDVLQEAMLVASNRIRTLVVDNEASFWTWMCRVVEQRLVDARRRHLGAARRDARREHSRAPQQDGSGASRLALLDADATSPSAGLRSAEQREALEEALASLRPAFREVIVLRILEGLSVQETAGIMRRTPGAVSVLLTTAIKRLGRTITSR